MSRSELVRALLTQFPALKPKEIERLLGEQGVSVDANLVGVARLRHRRSMEAERALCGLLAKLLDRRPDLLDSLQAAFDDLTQQVIEHAAARPGLSQDELVEALAAELPKQPPEETVAARASRIFLRVLERHPHYRHSIEVAFGLKAGSVHGVVVLGDGLTDDLTDEQIEAGVLQYLERNYPAGPSAEAIARAYMSKASEKVEQDHDHRQATELPAQGRAETILAMILDRLGSEVGHRDAAFAVVQQFVAENPDWTDEDIAEWLVLCLKVLTQPKAKPTKAKPKVVPDITGLTIRSRP